MAVKKIKKWALIVLLLLLLVITAGLSTFAFILNDLPNPEQFETRQVAQSTKIYDRTGETLLYEIHGEEKRTTVPYEKIPDYVKWASIAIEDSNFYNNPVFDWRGILRAFVTNLIKGRIVQGGSTITQQLAKNAFLSPERTIIRKIKELVVAYELEKRYSKDEILNLYLNQVPYGSNAYGIEAAAQTFFNKNSENINLAEAALLASLPRATSYYSPWGKHVDELMKRKDNVLEKMREFGYIDEEEKERAQNFEYKFADQSIGIKAPHFTLEVQEYLNNKYGEDFIRTAGLNVITTIDWKLQQIAEKAVLDGAERNKELYKGFNAALVAQDAGTGQILALVGSKNYFAEPEPENCTPGVNCRFEGNFNVATQGLRQPGSTMKPFTYLTAFEKGYAPDTIIFDLPTEFSANNPACPSIVDFSNKKSECFHPRNFDGNFRGPVTFRTALAQSINVPAVKVLYLAGIDNTLKNAQNFGLTNLTERSRYGLSLVLGGGEVTLSNLINAYSVLAQEGIKHNQTLVLRISDSKGNVLEEYKDITRRVVDSQYPRIINDILTDINERSGIFSASLPLTIFPGHQVALKTGTTNDYRDAWAIGYTPKLVAGVWAGNNNNAPMEKRGSSILAAVPIWSAFMKGALKERALVSFNRPSPVLTTKAILRGEYIANYKIDNQNYPQIHNILFYIDKNNPQGNQPSNPENDSQFENWEVPVLRWAEKTIPNFFGTYNHLIPLGVKIDSGAIYSNSVINISSPENGSFIKNKISVEAQIQGRFDIKNIQLFFNDQLMDNQTISESSKEISYQFNLIPNNARLQNSLKIKVIDAFGNEIIKELILFK